MDFETLTRHVFFFFTVPVDSVRCSPTTINKRKVEYFSPLLSFFRYIFSFHFVLVSRICCYDDLGEVVRERDLRREAKASFLMIDRLQDHALLEIS